MTEKVTFRVGDEDVDVGVLSWAMIEDHVMPLLEKGSTETRWYIARGNDIRILAEAVKKTHPDLTLDVIRERLTFDTAREVSAKLADLLRISGFTLGEAQAASDSTETSTDSSPDSSAGDTPPSPNGTQSSES